MQLMPIFLSAVAKVRGGREYGADLPLGLRIAVSVSNGMGSWTFMLLQGALMGGWMAWNELAPKWLQFDPYPYILLNLAMSAEAAFTAPLLLMSNKLEGDQDRRTFVEDLKTDRGVLSVVKQIAAKMGIEVSE